MQSSLKAKFLASSLMAGAAGLMVQGGPAHAQAGQAAQPGESACQAPAGQVDKAACPDASGAAPEAAQADDLTAPPSGEANGPEIVVTGSRIPRSTFNSPDSITVITRDRATDAGFNSTAQLLQSTAVTGGTAQINDTYGGLNVDGGAGANTLSLRGLGATRSLVLLNGRRVAPAGAQGAVGSADLNVLPNAIIDRIEVLNSGASSIYGSDAVAGVVNIITRNRINGISLEASHVVPEIGAGASRRYSAVGGTSGGNWSLQGSVEYFQRDHLRVGDVPALRCGTQRYRNGAGTEPGSGDFIDPVTGEPKCFPLEEGGVTINTVGTGAYAGTTVALAPGAPAGYMGACTRFRPNPLVTTGLVPGFECVGGGSLDLNLRDTSSAATLRQSIVNPAEILTGYLSGNLDTSVLGGATFYAEVLASRRKSSDARQLQLNIDYPVNSPLIPLALRARPLNSSIGLRVFGDRGAVEARQQVDFVKLSGGLRGDLPFADWQYNVYSSKTWSDASYTTNNVLLDRLAQSLDVVPSATAAGGFACRDTSGGCVAAPAFSAGVVSGGYLGTPFYDYITQDVTGTTRFRDTTFTLDVNGSLFQLPGGEVKVALGAEYRKSSISDRPDPNAIRANLQNYASTTPTIGSDSVKEVYAEVQLPILSDVPFFQQLTVDGSVRYTDYESYGGQTTYKVGALWRPADFLSFRGSYGTSYRAPALFEQFLGESQGFLSSSFDPCDNLAAVTDPLTREQCLADGLPADFVQNSGVSVIGVGGADAGLKAETSTNLTFGAVLQHDFGDTFGRISLAADYFRIQVDNGVAQLTATSILAQCYEAPQRTTCGLVDRAPYTGPGTGGLSVTQSYVNIATSFAKGIDFVANYTRPIGSGTFSLDAQVVHMLERYDRTLPTDDIVDLVGLTANPAWAGTLDTRYKIGRVTIGYGLDYLSATDDEPYLNEFGYTPDFYDFKVGDYLTHRASLRLETERFGFVVGVRNLFNKQPPKISTDNPLVNTVSNVPIQGGYDFLGRTFFINGRVSF